MIKHIDSDTFDEEVLNSEKVILVDFFATWCAPCQMLAPILEEISEDETSFDVAKVDIDNNQQIAMDYGIDAVPTMLIFKNGEIEDKIQGYTNKDVIIDIVKKYI